MEKKDLKIEKNKNKQNTFIINYDHPVERTSKDFQIFYEHLLDSNSDLLIPKLHKNYYEDWLYRLYDYNNIDQIHNQNLHEFFTNEKYIIQGKEKNFLYYVNKYAKKIESVIQNTLDDKLIGIFYDDENESKLFEFEKQYEDLNAQMNFVKDQYKKFKNQKKFLNEKIIDLQKNSKFIINDKSVFIDETDDNFFTNNFDQYQQELENIIQISDQVLKFFKRKNNLYELYRKMKNQVLKSQKNNQDDQTINNPAQILKILQQKISNYNKRLVHYLQHIEKYEALEQNFQKILKKITKIYKDNLNLQKNSDKEDRSINDDDNFNQTLFY